MDVRVLEAQQWCNATYRGRTGYVEIDEDGIAGASTCKALVRALQIELGLSADGVMGAGTVAACPTISNSTANANLVKIVQCGFYCKGYECGGIDGVYSEATASAAYDFVSDVGFPNATGTMSGKLVQALLNTDPFRLISGGSSNVRSAQQYLNREYLIYMTAFKLIPCTGIPDRNMMKAIIAALQYEEAGHSMSGVDGIYGNNTLNNAPTLATGTTKEAYVKIAKMCMMCMYQRGVGFTGVYDSSFATIVESFQRFYCLDGLSGVVLGEIGKTTWAFLLSSKGYTSRTAKACDTSTQILTDAKALALKNAGYEIVGRYLTGTVGGTRDKSLSIEEILLLEEHGLRIFPIFQEGGASVSDFGKTIGREDARKAIEAARNLAIPENTIIYFAVDYDFTEAQTRSIVIPHFEGINDVFEEMNTNYRVGIYGSRNICSMVAEEGLSCSSFVSDMSTGYSGNLGFPLPSDWAFDQFHEYDQSAADGAFDVDKVAYSRRNKGFIGVQCAGINEKDVTKHTMIFQPDGYYVCPACGLRVKSPSLEDADILSYDDYMKVHGLQSMYSFLIASDFYSVYFYDFWYKIHQIRSQSKYSGLYGYRDGNGTCLMIEPEAPNTGVQSTNNMVYAPVTITESNINSYNGVLDSLLQAATEIVCGFIFPAEYYEEFAQVLRDYQYTLDDSSLFIDCLKVVASAVGAGDWCIILDVMQIAANMANSAEKSELEIGDIVVEYIVERDYAESWSIYAVYNGNNQLKSIILTDGSVPA